MIRTQILLDKDMYRDIKRLAFNEGKSMAALIREMLDESLKNAGKKRKGGKRLKLSDFTFIGSAKGGKPDNVSERHDEVLGEGEW